MRYLEGSSGLALSGLLLYRGILWLALPFVVLRLWWRGRRDPTYRPRWQERFGFYTGPQTQGAVWFHTVSAGETIAAAPSIRAMAVDSDNGLSVLVTTMTPTGSEQVTALLGDTVGHCYAPYDFTFAVRRFLTEVNPRALILMETEIWPNLILEAKARGIPVILVNARLSEKSARGYQRLSWLSQRVLECFDLIACQTAEHAQRFIELGASAEKVQTVGNVKYDLEVPADTKEQAAMLGRPAAPLLDRSLYSSGRGGTRGAGSPCCAGITSEPNPSASTSASKSGCRVRVAIEPPHSVYGSHMVPLWRLGNTNGAANQRAQHCFDRRNGCAYAFVLLV